MKVSRTGFLPSIVAAFAALPLAAEMTWTDPDTGYRWTYVNIDSRCADIQNGHVKDAVYEPAVSPLPTGFVMVPFMVGDVKNNLNRIVTSLGPCAFWYCNNLQCATVHDGVTEIGDGAFNGCSGLKDVTIGGSVRKIGSWAFELCSALRSITFLGDAPETGMDLFRNVPSSCTVYVQKGSAGWGEVPGVWNGLDIRYDSTSFSTELIGECTWSYRVHDGMAEVYPGALQIGGGRAWAVARSHDFTVTVPSVLGGKPVTSIGYRSFFEYNVMDREYYVLIPDGVMSIGREAFLGSKLGSVSLPDSLVHIGAGAFKACQSLTDVIIPDVVKYIDENAFYGCTGLRRVTFLGDAPEIGENAFYNVPCTVYVQRGSKGWGVSIPGKWKGFDIEYESVRHSRSGGYTWPYRELDRGGIEICGGSEASAISPNPAGTVRVPVEINGKFVASVGRNAFRGCSEIERVEFESSNYGGLCEIGRYSFRDCSGLSSLTISDSVRSIASYAFYGCSGLKSITFNGNAPQTGKDVFSGVPPDCVVYVKDKDSTGWGVSIPGKWKGLDIKYVEEPPDDEALKVEVVDGRSWSYFIKDGTAHIYRGEQHSAVDPYPTRSVVAIPSVLGGMPVTEIGDCALATDDGVGGSGAAAVDIPGSVTRIGAYAFAGCNFERIAIPEAVTNIGDSAFADCIYLKSVTIPDSVESVGSYVFHKCAKLESVTVGSRVESLGAYAFYGCTSLQSVTFKGDAPKKLGKQILIQASVNAIVYVPYGSTGWNVAIPGQWQERKIVYSLPDPEWANGYAWRYLMTADGAEIYNIGNCAVSPEPSGDVTIPSTLGGRPVTGIGARAFLGCDGLTSVTIPSGVKSIGENAFYDCDGLTSVTIPASVTNIERYAFGYCDVLASVTIPSGVTSIGNNAFYNCDGLSSVTVPETVTIIGNYAFDYCDNLKFAVVPAAFGSDSDKARIFGTTTADVVARDVKVETVDGVGWAYTVSGGEATVGGGADDYAISPSVVGAVTIPSMLGGCPVTAVGKGAFYDCDGLTSVTIPNSVTGIVQWSFSYCDALASVTIPSGVTSIGEYAFFKCDELNNVTIPDSVSTIGDNAFQECAGLIRAVVPKAFSSQFEKTRIFGKTTGIGVRNVKVEIVNGVGWAYTVSGGKVTVGGGADDYAISPSTVGAVTIPSTLGSYPVKAIGAYAFYNCEGLTSVTIPSGVTGVGDYAFASCDGLASVTIPDSVTIIGKYAFASCTGLTSVTIPSSVTSMGDGAFRNDGKLKTVYVEDGDEARVRKLMEDFGGIDVGDLDFVSPNGYAIVFQSDSKGTSKVFQYLSAGKVAKLESCGFAAPAGKRFAGWRRADGGRRYDDGVLVFNLAEPGETVVMEAVWE